MSDTAGLFLMTAGQHRALAKILRADPDPEMQRIVRNHEMIADMIDRRLAKEAAKRSLST